MSTIAPATLDQFESLLISMLDSSEEETVALLSAAFLDAVLALAKRDGEEHPVVLVVCQDHEIIIRKSSETEPTLH